MSDVWTDYVVVWSGRGDDKRPADLWWSAMPHSTLTAWGDPGLSACCPGTPTSLKDGRATWNCPVHGPGERFAARYEIRVEWETLKRRLQPTRDELRDLIRTELRWITRLADESEEDE